MSDCPGRFGGTVSIYPQPGRPNKIALLVLNSTIFSLLLLSISENVGQRQDVDVLLKGRFTPPPSLSQPLTHWLNIQFTPILRDKAWNLIPFHSFAFYLTRKNKHRLSLSLGCSQYYCVKGKGFLLLIFILYPPAEYAEYTTKTVWCSRQMLTDLHNWHLVCTWYISDMFFHSSIWWPSDGTDTLIVRVHRIRLLHASHSLSM